MRRRLLIFPLKVGMLLMLLLLGIATARSADIWVAPGGNDEAAGTKDAPMATLSAALRKARELRRLKDPSVAGGIHIIIRGGEYRLIEPVFVRPEDSGTDGSPTMIEAASGEKPVLSGGRAVTGWQPVRGRLAGLPAAAVGKLWMADAPVESFRQLWVNGVKAVRARETDEDDKMLRILSVDTGRQILWIPAGSKSPVFSEGMEMLIHQWWATAVLRIASMTRVGDSIAVRFRQPESRIEFEHPWPAPYLDKGHKQNGNSAYYLVNSIHFLDHPGEWYAVGGKIYYWPRAGEDLTSAHVVVPALTTLVQVQGTIDRPVANLVFKGLEFSYATWLRPSELGHVPLQAGMYLLDAYKLKVPGTPGKAGLENQAWIGRPASAIEVSYAAGVDFFRCRFTHLASTGLDYTRGTRADTVRGCVFNDVGGTALQLGVYSDPAFETHLPYAPTDDREVCHNEVIEDNLVTDCTNEDWGCVGISAGYVHDVKIRHNEVREVSYSGICVGWGWTKEINCMRNNTIEANFVHHYAKHMYDVGGIYTLSAQPGTVITRNVIDSIYHPVYAHDPEHWFWFYFDEGSSYITITNNWCPGEKFMRNTNGPGNSWENNGPAVDAAIKKNAGLEPAYQ